MIHRKLSQMHLQKYTPKVLEGYRSEMHAWVMSCVCVCVFLFLSTLQRVWLSIRMINTAHSQALPWYVVKGLVDGRSRTGKITRAKLESEGRHPGSQTQGPSTAMALPQRPRKHQRRSTSPANSNISRFFSTPRSYTLRDLCSPHLAADGRDAKHSGK